MIEYLLILKQRRTFLEINCCVTGLKNAVPGTWTQRRTHQQTYIRLESENWMRVKIEN